MQLYNQQRYRCLLIIWAICLINCACTTHSPKELEIGGKSPGPNPTQEKAKTVVTGPVEILHKNKTYQPLWSIKAASSHVSYIGKQGASGKLEKVQGQLFKDGKISVDFTADHATVDEAKEVLHIWSNAQIHSEKAQTTLYADKIAWVPNEKMFQATGNVRIISKDYTLGPVPALKANLDMTDIGTPDTFKGDMKNR